MSSATRRLFVLVVAEIALAAAALVVAVAGPVQPTGTPAAFADGTGFVGVTPARVLDTRSGNGAPAAPVGPGGVVNVQITGRGGVPASGVSAVVLNVTVDQPTAAGFVTVFPTGAGRPTASNLNFVPGQTVPNLVIVKVGDGGKVALFNFAGSTHLIADVSGYYTSTSQLTPIVPTRLLDTRDGTGGVAGPTQGAVSVVVTGRAGVPAGATSVVLNVTVTQPTADTFLTVWPNGVPRPTASNLNVRTGDTAPNLVIAKVGSEGKVNYYNNAGRVHVVMDVLGYVVRPTYMTELLNRVAGGGGCCSTDDEESVTSQGVTYDHSLSFNMSEYDIPNVADWVEYNLGRQWGTLATTLTFDDDRSRSDSKVRFRILGDGTPLLDQTLTFGQKMDVTVNTSGVLRVRFEVTVLTSIGRTLVVFADPQLSTAAGAPFPPVADFTAITPGRILDTREGNGAAKGRVAPGATVDLQVLGRGGVPIRGVGAVVLNVTVANPAAAGYLTVYPSGLPLPVASNVNFLSGQVVPNLVVVPVGANGRVSIYNFGGGGLTDVIADVLGWYPGAARSDAAQVNMTELLDRRFSGGSCCSYFEEGVITSQGVTRFVSLDARVSEYDLNAAMWTEYNLSRRWNTLTTTLTFDDARSKASSKIRFRILRDGNVLADRTLNFGQAVPLTVNVANVLRVRFEVTSLVSGATVAAFADPVLNR